MTPARGFATLLLAAAAQPVAAERIAIPFAPPVGQQLAYDIDQHRPIAGQESRFSAHRTVRFERVGDGYQLYAVLRSLDSDASDAAAASFRAALTPLIGVEMRFHLDSQGKIIALDDVSHDIFCHPIESSGKGRVLDLDHRLRYLKGDHLSLIGKTVDHTDGKPVTKDLTLNKIRAIVVVERCQVSDHVGSVGI